MMLRPVVGVRGMKLVAVVVARGGRSHRRFSADDQRRVLSPPLQRKRSQSRGRIMEIARMSTPPAATPPTCADVVRIAIQPARLSLVPLLLDGAHLLPRLAHDARRRAPLGRWHPHVVARLQPVHVFGEEDIISGPSPLAPALIRGAVRGLLVHVSVLVRLCPVGRRMRGGGGGKCVRNFNVRRMRNAGRHQMTILGPGSPLFVPSPECCITVPN